MLGVASVDVLARLQACHGTYAGTGQGQFPTMPPFRYRELLHLTADAERSYLRFEQRTWLIDDANADIRASHWEVGFLTIQADGSVRLTSAQTGRLEAFTGVLDWTDNGFLLKLEGVQHLLDERVLHSAREWALDGSILSYKQWMTTTAVGTSTLHLSAQLARIS